MSNLDTQIQLDELYFKSAYFIACVKKVNLAILGQLQTSNNYQISNIE